MATVDVVDFLDIQRAGDVEFGPGLRSYVKATFTDQLSAELAAVLVERGRSLGSPLTQVELLSMGGAIKRVGAADTAFPHRNAGWLLNVPGSWTDAADSDREVAWVRETYAAIAPLRQRRRVLELHGGRRRRRAARPPTGRRCGGCRS